MAYLDRRELDTALGADLALSGAVGDYLALLKPRVMSLVVFTAFVGMAIARPTSIRWSASSRSLRSPSAPAPPARSTCGTTPTSTR